jgi:hypothetical protein
VLISNPQFILPSAKFLGTKLAISSLLFIHFRNLCLPSNIEQLQLLYCLIETDLLDFVCIHLYVFSQPQLRQPLLW